MTLSPPDSNDFDDAASSPSPVSASPALAARFERLRALRGAWGVLAASTLSAGGHPVAEIGRVLGDHLNDLAAQGVDESHADQLAGADAGLDEFARMLRSIAFEVSINELRAILPATVRKDRRGVLDLLDLLVDFDCEIDERPEHVGAIDYVITLLSTGAAAGQPASVRHDPVTLTPRLHDLCQRVAKSESPALVAEIETEFFAAANMDREAVYAEMEQRTLRRRKGEIGQAFYAPGVLRAIVTYNATLLQHVTDEISESQDWGALPGEAAGAGEDEAGSVFGSRGLRALAGAVKRRVAGDAPDTGAVDRVAWCLDLDVLDADESGMLLADGVGSDANPRGTAILVGLIERSLVVLEDELVALGIAPAHLTGVWVRELDEALKAETNALIASDAYDEACAIAGLKSKFLNGGAAPVQPLPRPTPVAARVVPVQEDAAPEEELDAEPEEEPVDVLAQARALAADALDETQAEASRGAGFVVPDWLRTLGAIAATIVVVAMSASVIQTHSTSDLDRFSGAQLETVSPYLTHGHRNGYGSGTAFVGFLGDEWNALDAEARTEAALDLVASLRAQGVRDIMVYDGNDRLRLQLLGDQPLRLVD